MVNIAITIAQRPLFSEKDELKLKTIVSLATNSKIYFLKLCTYQQPQEHS